MTMKAKEGPVSKEKLAHRIKNFVKSEILFTEWSLEKKQDSPLSSASTTTSSLETTSRTSSSGGSPLPELPTFTISGWEIMAQMEIEVKNTFITIKDNTPRPRSRSCTL